MRRISIKVLVCAVVAWVLFLGLQNAHAQSYTRYSVSFRSVLLNTALAEFARLTGEGISYDPALTATVRATCAIQEALADAVLNCILSDTGLDYVQLSSGTYVISASTEQEAIYGTIAGDVRDNTSGHPLSYAHILLASSADEFSTVSNSNGQFTLPPLLPGRYYLSTTHLGYRDVIDTLLVVPGRHSFRKITMEEAPIVFSPVVIDGLQRKEAATVLDESYLLMSDSMMVGHLNSSESIVSQVASVPGVRINYSTADAHLQGSAAGEHQFKLDGVPIFLPQRALGILGPFSPFALESITIHKTGFGVAQGSYLAGVVSANHKLSREQKLDLQLDPLAFNGRYVNSFSFKRSRKLEIMGAYRTSVWDLYQHPQFQSTLNQWSRPDPFLIFGPIRQYESIDPAFFEDALNIAPVPTTALSFSDIHVAGKFELSPFSAIRFSGFRGQNELTGFLPGLFSTVQDSLILNFGQNAGAPDRLLTTAPLSVSDQYVWKNNAAQVNYHTLLGRHTLFNLQARASSYRLSQNYKLVDGLSQFFDFPIDEADVPVAEPVYEFPIRQLEEQNDVAEFALEGTLEHAFNRHFVSGGFLFASTGSKSDILLPSLISEDATAVENASALAAGVERIAYDTRVERGTSFIHDRMDLGKVATLDLGLRMTYFFSNNQTYFEPRVALRLDTRLKNGGSFASRTAAGIYRQYLLQFDISTLNAGTLFPSKRIWIPVDNNIRPPLAYHFAQSFLLAPSDALTIKLEAYTKLLAQTYTVNYIPSPTNNAEYRVETANLAVGPEEFIPEAKSVNIGGSFSIEWLSGPFYAHLTYDYSHIRRKATELFNNEWASVPWNEPHRTDFVLQANVTSSFILSGRFTGVWGRSWGFRQAYYDYFGHRSSTRLQPPFDFGKPEDHVLPAIYQIDLGLAYNVAINNSILQLKFDVLNAFDRKNVADWRLLFADGQLEKDNRYLYPRIPSLSLRLSM
ncbi:MAG: carboxypeptidase regulatory-like domain-containing protein [Bacteroidota bacterium]